MLRKAFHPQTFLLFHSKCSSDPPTHSPTKFSEEPLKIIIYYVFFIILKAIDN